MNKATIQKIAKQQTMYRTEALAKRRNLLDEMKLCETENLIYRAGRLNEKAMMIVRTEAKAKAIEELAEALGIAEQVAALVDPGESV